MLSLTRPLLAIIFFFFAVVVLSSVGFVYYNVVPVVSDEIVPSTEQMERMLSKSATMYSPPHRLFPAFTSAGLIVLPWNTLAVSFSQGFFFLGSHAPQSAHSHLHCCTDPRWRSRNSAMKLAP